jgi:hypothetical protein
MTCPQIGQVWSPYWSWTDANFTVTAKHRDPALRAPPLQFSKKEHAIIYINTQCSAKSGRQDIIRHLQALLTASNSSLAVHSFGKCDPNMPPAELTKFHTDDVGSTRQHKKLAYFRRYKFCVVGLYGGILFACLKNTREPCSSARLSNAWFCLQSVHLVCMPACPLI